MRRENEEDERNQIFFEKKAPRSRNEKTLDFHGFDVFISTETNDSKVRSVLFLQKKKTLLPLEKQEV
jgi:hypothetical protein